MSENKENGYKFYQLNIDLDEFINQTESAAKRTRWTMIVLVLASVLIGIGFYNTTPLSFAPEGISSLNKFENLPVNNFAEADGLPMPLLDAYFGENDFRDTKFEKHFYNRFRDLSRPDHNQEEITGLQRFVCKGIYSEKNKEADTPGKYIYNKLNYKTKELLTQCEYKPFDFPKDPIKFHYLTTDLNRILTDKYLYKETRFPKTVLEAEHKSNGEKRYNREELLRLLAEWKKAQAENETPSAAPSPSPFVTPSRTTENVAILSSKTENVDIVRLNRLLLEAAFKDDINESTDIIPTRESRSAKELVTHLAFDENVRYVDIPFFDTSIEVNDLGAFGGIGLIIILLLLRFSLSREIKNLNVAFRQAFYKDKLVDFYHRLAMRLVLSVPKMEGESVNQTLSAGGKYICLLPALILSAGVWYDQYSINVRGLYKADEVFLHLQIEYICVGIVWYLSLRCLERLTHIDEILEDYHTIWDKEYLSQERELHEELLLKIPGSNPKLNKAVWNRVYNKSKKGRCAYHKNPRIAWLGRIWIVRLATFKNIARLIPSKWLAKRISGEKPAIVPVELIRTITLVFIVSFIAFVFKTFAESDGWVAKISCMVLIASLTVGPIPVLISGIYFIWRFDKKNARQKGD